MNSGFFLQISLTPSIYLEKIKISSKRLLFRICYEVKNSFFTGKDAVLFTELIDAVVRFTRNKKPIFFYKCSSAKAKVVKGNLHKIGSSVR